MWTFQPQNYVTSRISQGHSLYIKFEHFGIISFWVMLGKNKQTDIAKQTDLNVLPTPTDRVGLAMRLTK